VADGRFFGKKGSPYDFNGVNLNHARDQCRELESQQKGMGRKINTKVMNMIDKYVLARGLVGRYLLTC
jgi:structural maintenance of chromosome 2